ncbi:MAG: gephyrin-like molybdotransferase Glp [Verrucomicrobiota bacterium]
MAMLSEADAYEKVLAHGTSGGTEVLPLQGAFGRILRQSVTAQVAEPPFDCSAMDGFALGDVASERFHIAGEQPAGRDLGLLVRPGEAVRVFTGAPLPAGTVAVVPQEDVEETAPDALRLKEAVEPGEFIRSRGQHLCPGQVILEPGIPLTASRLALMASQGMTEATVGSLPRVSILTTGDELQTPGIPLEPGQIYESNGILLRNQCRQAGIDEVRIERSPDDPAEMKAILERLLEASDFLFICGGVSVGARDFVKGALTELGVETVFWRVRMQPGKPLYFGVRDRTQVFGLPGNPVSGLVCLQVFGLPALRKWQGAGADVLKGPTRKIRMGEALINSGERPHYFRGRVDSAGQFRATGRQVSNALFGLSKAEVLVRVEAGQTLEKGAMVQALEL